jgi:hypothetical protein
MARRGNNKFLFAAVLLVLAAALAVIVHPYLRAQNTEDKQKPQLGLFSNIPIYWGETVQLSDLIAQDRQAHWARPALERFYQLIPLDILSNGEGAGLGGDRSGRARFQRQKMLLWINGCVGAGGCCYLPTRC